MTHHDKEAASEGSYFDLLDAISGRWAIVTIEALQTRPLRMYELRRRLRSVPSQALSTTLSNLIDAGVIARRTGERDPSQPEYSLTDTGTSALKPLIQLHLWAKTHYEEATMRAAAEDAARRYLLLHRPQHTDEAA